MLQLQQYFVVAEASLKLLQRETRKLVVHGPVVKSLDGLQPLCFGEVTSGFQDEQRLSAVSNTVRDRIAEKHVLH